MTCCADERSLPVVVLVLLALLVGTVLAALAVAGRPRLAVPAAALASSAATAWVLLGRPLDGPVLLALNDSIGIHASDLLAAPAAGLVAELCRRAWRDRG